MKKQSVVFLILMIGMGTACSLEQQEELIITPKNKKKYVTKEQCIDMKIDSIVRLNEFNREFNVLRQTVDILQKEDLGILSEYADGEKDCFFKRADKVGLTEYHAKEMKKNQALERSIRKIKKMNQEFQALRAEMQKIQSE